MTWPSRDMKRFNSSSSQAVCNSCGFFFFLETFTFFFSENLQIVLFWQVKYCKNIHFHSSKSRFSWKETNDWHSAETFSSRKHLKNEFENIWNIYKKKRKCLKCNYNSRDKITSTLMCVRFLFLHPREATTSHSIVGIWPDIQLLKRRLLPSALAVATTPTSRAALVARAIEVKTILKLTTRDGMFSSRPQSQFDRRFDRNKATNHIDCRDHTSRQKVGDSYFVLTSYSVNKLDFLGFSMEKDFG